MVCVQTQRPINLPNADFGYRKLAWFRQSRLKGSKIFLSSFQRMAMFVSRSRWNNPQMDKNLLN